MESSKADFHQQMLQLHRDIKKKANYVAGRLWAMLEQHGGLETAKLILSKPSVTSGFTRLYEIQKPELTIESLVLKPENRALFTQGEIKIAEDRMEGFKKQEY